MCSRDERVRVCLRGGFRTSDGHVVYGHVVPAMGMWCAWGSHCACGFACGSLCGSLCDVAVLPWAVYANVGVRKQSK